MTDVRVRILHCYVDARLASFPQAPPLQNVAFCYSTILLSVIGMSVSQNVSGHTSKGLDRASMHVYAPLDAKGRDEQGSPSSMEIGPNSYISTDNGSSPIASISRISSRLRSKLHKRPKEVQVPSNDQGRSESAMLVPALAPAPPETTEKDRFSEAPPSKPNLPPAKEFITNPVQTARTIAHAHGGHDLVENLAKTDTTHGASVRIVRAYDKIAKATTDSDEELALKNFELLKKARQDSFVRWTLDRHIQKVRQLQAHRIPMQPRKDFLVVDECGKEVTQWNSYGNHVRVLVF